MVDTGLFVPAAVAATVAFYNRRVCATAPYCFLLFARSPPPPFVFMPAVPPFRLRLFIFFYLSYHYNIIYCMHAVTILLCLCSPNKIVGIAPDRHLRLGRFGNDDAVFCSRPASL